MTRVGKVVRAIFLTAIAVGLFVITVRVAAQDHAAPQNVPKYNLAQEQTVKGVVQEIKDYHCPISGSLGTHISIKTDSGELEVHLAPTKFLKDYDILLRKGADVVITGNKLEFDGKPAMVARLVKMGNNTFAFRDDTGRPNW